MDKLGRKGRIGIAVALVVALVSGIGYGVWNMSHTTPIPQDNQEQTETTTQETDSSVVETNEEQIAEEIETPEPEPIEAHQGTLAVAVEGEDANPVVTEDTVLGIINITLQDTSFQLPYSVQELLALGWESESFADEATAIEPLASLKSIPLHMIDNPDAKIQIDVTNLGDEAVTWDQAHCTGLRVPAENGVSLSCMAGFGTNTSFDEMYELIGAGTNARRIGSRREVALQVIVDAGGERPIAGEISYAAEDGHEGLSELHIALTAFRDRPDTPEGQERPDQPSQPQAPEGPGGPR